MLSGSLNTSREGCKLSGRFTLRLRPTHIADLTWYGAGIGFGRRAFLASVRHGERMFGPRPGGLSMDHAKSSEGPTRRDLLTLIGMTAGSAAMYQAMTSLGLRRGIRLQGTHQAGGRSKRRLGAHPGRGSRRHDGGAGIAPGRLQGADPRIQQPRRAAGTGPCAAAIPTPSSAAPPRSASSTRASTSIPARGASPITTTDFWPTASGSG